MLNIGICDDNQLFRELTELYLRQYAEDKNCDFNILQFGSGEELLSWLDRETTGIEILFIDYQMKVLTGLETARIILRRKPSCLIVFITSMDKPYELMEVQPVSIMQKPVTQKMINEILDCICIGHI